MAEHLDLPKVADAKPRSTAMPVVDHGTPPEKGGDVEGGHTMASAPVPSAAPAAAPFARAVSPRAHAGSEAVML